LRGDALGIVQGVLIPQNDLQQVISVDIDPALESSVNESVICVNGVAEYSDNNSEIIDPVCTEYKSEYSR
jgi:hypothetical protein